MIIGVNKNKFELERLSERIKMMKIFLFSALLVKCIFQSSLVYALPDRFTISGSNTIRGDYQGWINIWPNNQVQRVIQYNSFTFEKNKVQEAWLGQRNSNGKIVFETSMAHFIFGVNDQQILEPTAFTIGRIEISPSKRSISFKNSDGSTSTETLEPSLAPIPPTFQLDFNTRLRDVYSSTPIYVKAAIGIAKAKLKWDSDPKVQELKARSHCVKSKISGEPRAQSYEDFTDLKYYPVNSDIVRAYNAPATNFALAEGLYRKAAFSKTLKEKVELADKSMEGRFINQWGMNSHLVFNPDGSFFRFHDHDSALWTGEYIAYLSEQYLKSKDSSLLEKIKKSATGLMMLVEVFEGTQEFGRTIEDYGPGETLTPEWQIFNLAGKSIKVKKGGNNDMYKGLLLGLISASLSVPKNDLVFHLRLQKVAKLILNLKVQTKSNSTKLLSYGLAALEISKTDYKDKFVSFFKNFATQIYRIYDGVFYWNGTSDYSGVNLGIVGLYSSLILARTLNTPEVIKSIEEQTLKKKKTFADLKHFEVLLLLKKIRKSHLDNSEHQFLDATLATIPYPRPSLSIKYDHSWEANFCLSPTPYQFWKAYGSKPQIANEHVSSLTNYPLYTAAGIDSNYVFKDAFFKFKGQIDGNVQTSPIDILFAWTLYSSNEIE